MKRYLDICKGVAMGNKNQNRNSNAKFLKGAKTPEEGENREMAFSCFIFLVDPLFYFTRYLILLFKKTLF